MNEGPESRPAILGGEAGGSQRRLDAGPNGWEDVRRILAVRLDNIGDVVMLGPALRALRHALPRSSITLLCSPAGSQIAPLLPWLDEVLVHRAVWQDVSGSLPLDQEREMALVQEIRSRSFDAAFIFTSFSQSPYPPASVCFLAGVPRRIGQSKEFGGGILSQWVKPQPDAVHQVDRNLHLLASVGIPPVGHDLELSIPSDVRIEAEELLREAGIAPTDPFVLLAPGASCSARRYDPGRFAAVGRILEKRTGYAVVLVGSQRERDLGHAIASAAGDGVRSLVGRTSVPHLAAVVGRASLVVTSHSGPMHLADAFRRPTVVLFSGTDLESQWRPRAAPTRMLRRWTSCSPCYLFRCAYNMECLDIPPVEVAENALELLHTHYGVSSSAAISGEETGSNRRVGADGGAPPGRR